MAEATGREAAGAEMILGQNNYGIYDLERFDIEKDKEIFHATQYPYGQTEGT